MAVKLGMTWFRFFDDSFEEVHTRNKETKPFKTWKSAVPDILDKRRPVFTAPVARDDLVQGSSSQISSLSTTWT